MNIDANDPEEDNVNTKEITRASALYLLKLQEECFLPKTTVKGVVENTKTIVQETLSVVKTQVEQCLSKNNIEPQGVPGLKLIFQESSTITNPFNDLETESQQNTYYKENFQLKVGKYFNCEIWGWQIERIWYIQNRNCTIFYSPQKLMFICHCRGLTKKLKCYYTFPSVLILKEPQRIILRQKEVYKRRKGILQATQSNDEAYYISFDSSEQLLNDEFVLEQVHHFDTNYKNYIYYRYNMYNSTP